MRIRTCVAKLLMATAGVLSYVKTPQRIYEWMGVPDADATDEEWVKAHHFEYLGHAWLPCHLTVRLTVWAEDLDRRHFKHWALEPLPVGTHVSVTCDECGGRIYPVNLNEEVIPS